MGNNQVDYERLFKEEHEDRKNHKNFKKKVFGKKKFRRAKKQSDYRKRAVKKRR